MASPRRRRERKAAATKAREAANAPEQEATGIIEEVVEEVKKVAKKAGKGLKKKLKKLLGSDKE